MLELNDEKLSWSISVYLTVTLLFFSSNVANIFFFIRKDIFSKWGSTVTSGKLSIVFSNAPKVAISYFLQVLNESRHTAIFRFLFYKRPLSIHPLRYFVLAKSQYFFHVRLQVQFPHRFLPLKFLWS